MIQRASWTSDVLCSFTYLLQIQFNLSRATFFQGLEHFWAGSRDVGEGSRDSDHTIALYNPYWRVCAYCKASPAWWGSSRNCQNRWHTQRRRGDWWWSAARRSWCGNLVQTYLCFFKAADTSTIMIGRVKLHPSTLTSLENKTYTKQAVLFLSASYLLSTQYVVWLFCSGLLFPLWGRGEGPWSLSQTYMGEGPESPLWVCYHSLGKTWLSCWFIHFYLIRSWRIGNLDFFFQDSLHGCKTLIIGR